MGKQVPTVLLAFVAGTIITGTCNSIFTKLQDFQCVKHCAKHGNEVYFSQPVIQTIQMFIGEMLCWIPLAVRYFTRGDTPEVHEAALGEIRPLLSHHEGESSGPKKTLISSKDSLVLAVPAICDILGTTLMNAGLLYTPVSIYQMTRGALILFVGLFSVLFLKRYINRIEWTSLFLVFVGLFLVGLSGYLNEPKISAAIHVSSESVSSESVSSESVTGITLGCALILLGIIFSAFQFVSEEKILGNLEVAPLQLVAWEGLYGFLFTTAGAIVGYAVVGHTESGRDGIWDLAAGLHQVFSNKMILVTSVLIMLSISSFNFFGISLTNKLNATARSTIDTSRTLLVWIVSMFLAWESFSWLQLVGFAVMVYGTLVFNGVINVDDKVPKWLRGPATKDSLIVDEVEEGIVRR